MVSTVNDDDDYDDHGYDDNINTKLILGRYQFNIFSRALQCLTKYNDLQTLHIT